MKLYFAKTKRTSSFTLFFAKKEISLREKDEVLIQMDDGVWTATIIDYPIFMDVIEGVPVFHGYIGTQERKIIEQNYEIERETQEKIIDYFGERDLKVHITGAESNFNRTKLLVYYEKKEGILDFNLYRDDISEILKMDVEFVAKFRKDCCLTYRFVKDFGFAQCTTNFRKNQRVVVQGDDGLWAGNFLQAGCSVKKNKSKETLRVLGPVDAPMERVLEKIEEDEEYAFDSCIDEIIRENLDMNLLKAEYSLSERKVIFYYTAEGRVDFRTLVKTMAGILKKRIEMRQIGIRDELRTFPTIGICGQKTCCSRFLHHFDPVVLKMAKLQNLDINTEKITGLCNRLLCCLRYEYQNYQEFMEKMNSLPKRFKLKGENGDMEDVEVVGFNPVKETVILRNRDNMRRNEPYEELKETLERRRKS